MTVKVAVGLLGLVPVQTVDAVSAAVAAVYVPVGATQFWRKTNHASSNNYSARGGGGVSKNSRGMECLPVVLTLTLAIVLIVVTAVQSSNSN